MGLSPQSSDKHGQWLDDELARNPGDVDETPEADLWDSPGHDGIVSTDSGDPDRTDLRSTIGAYVSLVGFPATVEDLIASAEAADAPGEVVNELRKLAPARTFPNAAALWDALGLGDDPRF